MLKFTGLIIIILIALTALLWPGELVNGEDVLSGQDILDSLKSAQGPGEFVINVGQAIPAEVYDDSGLPVHDGYKSYESIFIFSDGEVLSVRDYGKASVAEFENNGYYFDNSWDEWNSTGRRRFGKYHLRENQLIELLNSIGEYKLELRPGDSVVDYSFGAGLKILYGGKEGVLSEPISLGIESKENLAFITYILDKVLKMENEAEVTPVTGTYMIELKQKKEQYNWPEKSSIQGTVYTNITRAWRAHGLIK